jgi:hypothetical protein
MDERPVPPKAYLWRPGEPKPVPPAAEKKEEGDADIVDPETGRRKVEAFIEYRNCDWATCSLCGGKFVWTADRDMAEEAEAKKGMFRPVYAEALPAGKEVAYPVRCPKCSATVVIMREEHRDENDEARKRWWQRQGQYIPVYNVRSKGERLSLSGKLQPPANIMREPEWIAQPPSLLAEKLKPVLRGLPQVRQSIINRYVQAGWAELLPNDDTLQLEK